MPMPTMLIVPNMKNILYPRLVIIVGVTLETTKSSNTTLRLRLPEDNRTYSTTTAKSSQARHHNASCVWGRSQQHKPTERDLKDIQAGVQPGTQKGLPQPIE
jgi:hypothetical protein